MTDQPDRATLRAALERCLAFVDRVIDPWNEGFHETTEQSVLADLAVAATAYLDRLPQELQPPADAGLAAALDRAAASESGVSVFTRLQNLDRAVRGYLAAIGEPVRRQGD